MCYSVAVGYTVYLRYIKRIYVRAEFPFINESYRAYLLEGYEGTYYPASVIGAGRSAYVKRNREMINHSQFCVFYCKEEYTPKGRKSGTKIALDYAAKRNKTIYRFPLLPSATRGDVQ